MRSITAIKDNINGFAHRQSERKRSKVAWQQRVWFSYSLNYLDLP